MWTDREREIAKQLNNKEVKEFLEKVFVKLETQNNEELRKNIVALSDAEYGQLMKVIYLTKKENKAKLQLLTQIATQNKELKHGKVAPR